MENKQTYTLRNEFIINYLLIYQKLKEGDLEIPKLVKEKLSTNFEIDREMKMSTC